MAKTKAQIAKDSSFSDFEKQAMRDRAKELAAEAKFTKNKADGEKVLLAAISEMAEQDKIMATKIHEIAMKAAPDLYPKTWYSMPAYADKEGKTIFFFQAASKFKARYSTLGFSDLAKIDDGNLFPTSFALIKLTDVEAQKIAELIRKAVS